MTRVTDTQMVQAIVEEVDKASVKQLRQELAEAEGT